MRTVVCLALLLCLSACTGGARGRVIAEGGVSDASTDGSSDARSDRSVVDGRVTDATAADSTTTPPTVSELVNTINDYREGLGMSRVPFSPSLQIVAETHATDLRNFYGSYPAGCNLHSWSESPSWSDCCYTSDHARAACMWDKPRELTSYPGNGYEISAAGTSTPERALSAWMRSPGHHDVILNRGTWTQPWGAVGGAIDGGFAVVWFGREADPAQ